MQRKFFFFLLTVKNAEEPTSRSQQGRARSAKTRKSHSWAIYFHLNFPSVAPTSRDARVCPLCPEKLVLGNSKRSMCALARRKCGAMHGRSQKGCCLIAMLCIHPCIQNGTLSLRNRASGTVKGFSCFMASSEVFRGYSSLQNPEKCALYSVFHCVISSAVLLQADSGHMHF